MQKLTAKDDTDFVLLGIRTGALLALDALVLAEGYPQTLAVIHSVIGSIYEKLKYMDMAIEEYYKAFALDPQHKGVRKALRRLDQQFAGANPEWEEQATGAEITRNVD